MRGISKRTTKLGFHVLRLHYTADPDKDPSTPAGKRWLKEAKKGMSDARWRQEHEIDYGALGGTVVFPEFDESIHYIDPPEEEWIAENWTTYLGCDPHPRRAHAFVWMMINKYGDLVVPWSLWPEEANQKRREANQPQFHCSDYVKMLRIVEQQKLFPDSYIDLMDPAGANFDAAEDVNYFERYRQAGIIFRPAKKNREYAGYAKISEMLRCEEIEGEQRPRLTILRGCGDNHILVQQLKGLRYKELRGAAVMEKDPPADPMNKDKHLIDCVSYILLDDPRFVEPRRPSANRGELPRTYRVGG
jgi:hypothetical protein